MHYRQLVEPVSLERRRLALGLLLGEAPALVARNHARLGDVQHHLEVAIAVETLLSADRSFVC